MHKIPIPIQTSDEELIPCYATSGASGADLKANISEPVILNPGCSVLIPTGIKVEIPIGFEIQVRPRSGLALKNQLTVLNTPGTIDADYRGEICVILINHGLAPMTITPKMRIAQIVLVPVFQADFVMQNALNSTLRGEGSFGHTGTN